MFIIAQIPFVDMRLLIKNQNANCFFPNTFNRHYEKATYYRFLGSEKNRYNPNELPVKERTYFDSRKLLYIADKYGKKSQYGYVPQLLFARFFGEKQSFHFDIGLRELNGDFGTDRRDIRKFAEYILQTPFLGINDRYDAKEKKYSILGLEKALRDIYLYATSSKKVDKVDLDKIRIVFGNPALFIIYDRKEQHIFGKAKAFHVSDHIEVKHELVSVGYTFIDVWYIGKESIRKHDQDLRNLRIYLSKLHSCKESTRIILDYSDWYERDNIDIYKFESYLRQMQKLLNRKRYYSFQNKNFEDLAFYLDETNNEITWKDFRKRIELKLEGVSMSKKNGESENSLHINVGHGVVFSNTHNLNIGDINIYGTSKESINEYIKEFDELKNEFDKILNSYPNLTMNEKAEISTVSADSLDCVRSNDPERSKIKEKYENLKNVLGKMLSSIAFNHDKIEKLLDLGEKIYNFFK